MNLERKNTLFVISLVTVVLLGVAAAAFVLVREHVQVSINEDLERARSVFVEALVDVARGMGIRTIAEFVENEQVYQRVRSLGVDYVQGYYPGKPRVDLFSEGGEQQADYRNCESVA